MRTRFEHLLAQCAQEGASDLHLSSGVAPVMRVHGALKAYGDPLSAETLAAMVAAVLAPPQWEALQRERGADLGYALPDGTRFRLNLYHERGGLAVAARRLETRIPGLSQLRLPEGLHALASFPDGLVLVTGPTGSGKSTTLAALIEEINRHRACHILTVEDPIEYMFQNRRALVHQREVQVDVPNFADAVRAALREDPDVMLVGEMRDLATMRAAVTAAETGHLVFSTLHTGDAVGAIDRIVGAFPAEEQNHVRQQLSLVLRAVVTQHLLIASGGRGRIPAVEVLMVTPAVASLIRQNKPRQIYSMMEAGRALGMQTIEQSLAFLVGDGLLDEHTARLAARDAQQFEQLLAAAQRRAPGEAPWR